MITLNSSKKVLITLTLPALLVMGNPATGQQPAQLLGAACTAVTDSPVSEPGTGRTFVLDYPCDLQSGEEVTIILNLHGGGSSERYQRPYFPAWELKEKYRLVIATPHSPARRWREELP